MNFELNQDQQMLRDSVRKWIDNEYGFEHYRAVVKAGGFMASNWEQMAQLGLCGLAVPEAHGGMSMGPIEAMLVSEEMGRGLVCEPYADLALMATAILRDDSPEAVQTEWLSGIADGSKLVSMAFIERHSRYSLNYVATKATKSASNTWSLSGDKSIVLVGHLADALIVSARISGTNDARHGIGLFLVAKSAAGFSARSYLTQSGAAAAEISLSNTPAICLTESGLPALERAIDIGIAALCAQAVGAMDKLYDLTLDYLNTRKQFGVVIGTFQALRHRVADMKMQLELARSMSYFATLKLTASEAERRYAVSAAKVQIGESLRYVGQQGVQLHGGIAVTDEYSAGHYFKYLTSIELSLGDRYHHLGEVSCRMGDSAGVFA
jgi:alkylation response protein AidB-like acyl-CoA dehydrogenase